MFTAGVSFFLVELKELMSVLLIRVTARHNFSHFLEDRFQDFVTLKCFWFGRILVVLVMLAVGVGR